MAGARQGIAAFAAHPVRGSTGPAFTLAIAHTETGTDPPRVVLDLCRGWRTPNVETVAEEIVER